MNRAEALAAVLADIERGEALSPAEEGLAARLVRSWVPPAHDDARQRRDEAVRQYAAYFCTRLTRRAAAEKIVRDEARYSAGEWRTARHAASCPHEPRSPNSMLWEIKRSHPHLPDADRLRKILGRL